MKLNGIYSYAGFYKPEKIAGSLNELLGLLKSNELVISDNYSGGANSDIIEMIEDEYNDLETLHDDLVSYNLWLDPLVSEFQEINTHSYGLDKNCYLTDFIN